MKPELLAPAGNLRKLKCALNFGADAVYAGCKAFSLRAFADNFTEEELAEGIAYAHARGKKVYVAVNIFARNADLSAMEEMFVRLQAMKADAALVSDLGALALCRRAAPALPVHVSTQANVTNFEAARAFHALGASRVVLARELSFAEIAAIHAACPLLELECFVHGAMCISYSGRCYLSDYLDGRPANRGACVQACRRAYRIRSAGQDGWCDLEEDGRGTYVMNSRDLNLSAHLAELAAAGVVSFKIEGRMKSEYYLATVVNAYRRILDGADAAALASELECVDHRAYTTAYALGENHDTVLADGSQTAGTREFVAVVLSWKDGRACVEMRNRFREGEVLEILSPGPSFGKSFAVQDLRDSAGAPCADAKLVQEHYTCSCPFPLAAGDLLRRRKLHPSAEKSLPNGGKTGIIKG